MSKNIIIIDITTDKIQIKNLTNKLCVCKDFKNKKFNEKTFIKLLKKIGVNINDNNKNYFYSVDIISDEILFKNNLSENNYTKICNNYYDTHNVLEELTGLKRKIHYKNDPCSLEFCFHIGNGLKYNDDDAFDHLKAHEYIRILYINSLYNTKEISNIGESKYSKKGNHIIFPPRKLN